VSDHYFTARPETAHRPGHVHVLLPDVHLELDTDAGVFSPSRLDTGTRLLLDVDTRPADGGDLLDLGCGYASVSAGKQLCDLSLPKSVTATFKALFLIFFF